MNADVFIGDCWDVGFMVYVYRVWAPPRPMNADDFLELSAGIYGVQNMHLFKLRGSEAFSSFWKLGGPHDFRAFF